MRVTWRLLLKTEWALAKHLVWRLFHDDDEPADKMMRRYLDKPHNRHMDEPRNH